jgi:toxin ParE1/3/4
LRADKPVEYEVLLTRGAEQDLEALHAYIAEADSPAGADRLLDQLIGVVESLRHFPERGSHPRELLALGIKEYRQTAFKPYRVIYRVAEHRVLIYLIVDGRRDMQSLLARRLLGA